jgi:hypothetical protein
LQLFFDRNGDLYLADSVRGISLLKNGAPAFRSLHLQGLVEPTGVVVDPLNGDVIVSDASTNMIRVYASGATLPKRSIDSDGTFHRRIWRSATSATTGCSYPTAVSTMRAALRSTSMAPGGRS